MSSSEDARGEAFRFFTEWVNSETKLLVLMVLEGVHVSAQSRLTGATEDTLTIFDCDSKLKVTVPLEGCSFKRADPQRDFRLAGVTGNELESMLFKMGWEIRLPSGGRLVLGDCDL